MIKKTESLLKICGTCKRASSKLDYADIKLLKKRNPLLIKWKIINVSDDEVSCRKENIKVNSLEEACAFWISSRQYLSQAKFKTAN